MQPSTNDSRQPLVSELSRRRKLARVARDLPRACSILEVGSGSGWFARRLRERGHRVTTLDVEPPADYVCDVRFAPPEIGLYDVVIAFEVIEHVDCLSALVDHTRVGGLLFLSTPHPRWDWVMLLLESAKLTQKRPTPHSNLTDLAGPLDPRLRLRWLERPAWVAQIASFERTR